MSTPSRTCEIAFAAGHDIEGILDLVESVAAEGNRWIATEFPIDRERRWQTLYASLAREDCINLIARGDDAVVGQLVLATRGRGLLELGMLVRKDWRGQGVGKALLAKAIESARALGSLKITLEVFPHNSVAIALYEKRGFVREGYFHRHCRLANGDVLDTIPMGLVLE